MVSDDNTDGHGSETFVLLNGLSVDDDDVLGDYQAYVTNGEEGVQWILTARSGGELLWVEYGEVTDAYESDKFTATVTEYAESDCDTEAYGETHPSFPNLRHSGRALLHRSPKIVWLGGTGSSLNLKNWFSLSKSEPVVHRRRRLCRPAD